MIEGIEAYKLASELFPICRSITGEGVRKSIKLINEKLNKVDENLKLNISEIPTGTKVFDWEVPKEWEVSEAYIEDEFGKKVIDFHENNLHVMGYSAPIDKWLSLNELKKFVYVQEDQPEVIPYVTSYYFEKSALCMSKQKLDSLPQGKYHVVIKSSLFNGSLTYADLIIPGELNDEIFFSTYICHPSMANNECSGPALISEIIKYVYSQKNRKYSYRFVIAPETIGAISYLSTNNHLDVLKKNVKAAFVLTCVGDNRTFSLVESKTANTLADRVMSTALLCNTKEYKSYSYLERGSDERQYGSPGVDLPVVTFCRSKFEKYPEYHTSADNLSVISEDGFQGSFDIIKSVIDMLESNITFKSTVLCEPQLGKRGLYPTTSQKNSKGNARIIQDILAYADGTRDLIEIIKTLKYPSNLCIEAIKSLLEHGLIEEIE